MKNLPQNWVIDTQAEKDSPLMSKFMEWFEKNRTDFTTGHFYGKYKEKRVSRWPDSEEQTLITLEQWNAFYFPEWEPKQGERVLVRDCDSYGWMVRIFVAMYEGMYICEDTEKYSDGSMALFSWEQAKQLRNESILQPLVDQLKAEAKKLGIEKANITFE